MSENTFPRERQSAARRALLCFLLALVAPLLVLLGFRWTVGPPWLAQLINLFLETPAEGLDVASPFGWPVLAAMQVMAALPLSLLLAGYCVQPPHGGSYAPLTLRRMALVSLLAWVVMRLLVLRLPHPLLLSGEFAFNCGDRFHRTLWLTLPWCVAGRAYGLIAWPTPISTRARPLPYAVSELVLALTLAALVPCAYAWQLESRTVAQAATLTQQGRVWEAWRALARLIDVGSRKPVLDALPQSLQARLLSQLKDHLAAVKQPLPAAATTDDRLERATHLVALGRFAHARETLAEATQTDAEAALLAASTWQFQNRPRQNEAALREAIALLNGSARNAPHVQRQIIRAYAALAETLRQQNRFAEAEQELTRALDEWPENEAHWHYELGRHFELQRRVFSAAAHYREAAASEELAPLANTALERVAPTNSAWAWPLVAPVTR